VKWAPADVAQLTYLRSQGATYEAIAGALCRTRNQVKTKVGMMIRAETLMRRKRANGIARGRRLTFAAKIGIPDDTLPDYRLLRRKGYDAAEAVQMIRSWAA